MENFHMSVEDRNYARDRRVTATRAEVPVGEPFHWVVCDLCDGKATVINPSIDCCGLTREDFDDDPDFAEDYRAGAYDIPCPRCAGRSTIPVLDDPRPRCYECAEPYDERPEITVHEAQQSHLCPACIEIENQERAEANGQFGVGA